MKNLRKFNTTSDYQAASANLELPNVSLIVETMKCEYNPYVAESSGAGTLLLSMNANYDYIFEYHGTRDFTGVDAYARVWDGEQMVVSIKLKVDSNDSHCLVYDIDYDENQVDEVYLDEHPEGEAEIYFADTEQTINVNYVWSNATIDLIPDT